MKLTKTERKAIIKRIGDIIQYHCRQCQYNGIGTKVNNKPCLRCPHYRELRKLGDKLDGRDQLEKPSGFGLTEEKYFWFKELRFTDKDIADYYNLPLSRISAWKRENKVYRYRKPKVDAGNE